MDHFLHGGEYPETQGIRTEACSSCAFVNSPRTVRTPDITIPELIRQTAEFDDFVCHTAECGKTTTCRRWHDAHHTLRGSLDHIGYLHEIISSAARSSTISEEHTSELHSLILISSAVFS